MSFVTFVVIGFVSFVALVFVAFVATRRTESCRLDIGGAVGVARRSHFFDNHDAFVLDIIKISPIIYIWYEGGWLSPPVVTTRVGVRG